MGKEKQFVRKRRIYLAVGCTTMLCGGILYAWSILKIPFAETFGWPPAGLAFNFTIMMCCFCIGGLISGNLLRRYTSRKTLMIAALLTAAGLCMTSRISTSILVLYVTYGGLGGVGIGMMYNTVISAVNAWYPDQKGIVTGLLMMCYSASAMIFGKAADILMGEEYLGWRTFYLFLGIFVGSVFLWAGFLLRNPLEGETDSVSVKAEGKDVLLFQGEYTAAMLLTSPVFWSFFLYTISMSAVCNTVISFANDYALSLGAGGALAVTLVGLLSVCNGLGRMIGGKMIDLLGCWRTMLIANILSLLAVILAIASIIFLSLLAGVAALFLIGLSGGFSPTITSAFTEAAFGREHFSVNFGISNLAIVPASFTATFATLLVRGDSYLGPFVLLLGCAAFSFAMNRVLKRMIRGARTF